MSDITYKKFVKRWEEVIELPPQSLGPLTHAYKAMTKRLKVMPWPWFVGVSLVLACGLYLVFGPAVAGLVSLLQGGF